MNLGNNPGKIKSLVSAGMDGVKLRARDCSLAELELAQVYAETRPLSEVSRSARKQLKIEIRRKEKAENAALVESMLAQVFKARVR